jgi:hypothetical protein
MLEKFFDSSARGLARVRSLRSGLHGSRLNSLTRDGEVATTKGSPLLDVPMRSIGGEIFGKSRKRSF